MVMGLLTLLVVVFLIVIVFIRKSSLKITKSEQQLKNLFTNMKEGFVILNIITDDFKTPVDFIFSEVNHTFEQVTTLSKDQVMGRSVKNDLFNLDDNCLEHLNTIALNGGAINTISYFNKFNKFLNISLYKASVNQIAIIFMDITEETKAKEKIETERNLLETILEDTLSGYWDWDIKKDTIYLSITLKNMLGIEADKGIEKLSELKGFIDQEEYQKIVQAFEEHVRSKGEKPFYREIHFKHQKGYNLWAIDSGRIIEWDINDKPMRMVGAHIDITPLKNLEQMLNNERALLKTTLHSIGDAIISTDVEGNITLMNPTSEKLTGWSVAQAIGEKLDKVFRLYHSESGELLETPHKQIVKEKGELPQSKEVALMHKSGNYIPIEECAAPIISEKNELVGVVIVFRDITEKKEKQKSIEFLNYHDPLTSLYNRRFFENEMSRLEYQSLLPFTMVMIDVNGLKLTNDSFGHAQGDLLLKCVADILKKVFGSSRTIARIGGDEFVVFLPNYTSRETEKLVQDTYNMINVAKFDHIVVSVSIGYFTRTSLNESLEEVFLKAEKNMYRKKISESQSMRNETVRLILKTLYENNDREKLHSERVSKISCQIARAMHLSYEVIKEVEIAGLLHDVGKIVINLDLLEKKTPLTEDEILEIR